MPWLKPIGSCDPSVMSVENDIFSHGDRLTGAPPGATLTPRRRPGRRRFRRAGRPRVRKLRLLFVLVTFLGLATISTLFGILTSIASDLPALQNTVQFSKTVDSYMYDLSGNPIGPLAPASTPAIDYWSDISQNMVHAIVAVEDRSFWSEPGISVRGLVRAALSDVTGGPHEGASTIPEEFIKNVRQEEDHRTVLEKLVEAGMAFQLTHQWSHEKILTEYLNTIYFGNGALGIEAAARVYFGWAHHYDAANPTQEPKSGCGDPDAVDPHRKECASVLTVPQAALLAAMVANPTAYDPVLHPKAALGRRNDVVLKDMYEQHYISYRQYVQAKATPLPTSAEVRQPAQSSSKAPYFTSWVEPLVIRALRREGLSAKQAQYEAYYGGLKIKLSLDLNLQNYAQTAVNEELPPYQGYPTASLVAIDNSNGQVRAMVSGDGNYTTDPFNLATLGYRQPGSSFKLFTLAAALSEGKITPYTEVDSKQITIPFVKQGGNAFYAANGTGRFPVHNFGNVYAGTIPMTVATATSDNSVFAQVGMYKVGTAAIARYARQMGIRSPVSTNPSMILGGLNTGVSALDMAHAYSTVADGGVKFYNPTLGDIQRGPVGIVSITGCGECSTHDIYASDTTKPQRVLTTAVASTIHDLLHGPVDDSYGTGTAAAISGVDVAGKTGTTSNYVDAWFCGWTKPLTVCVWVGFENGGKQMLTQFAGKPVEGGTYPALIFHNFMVEALQVLAAEAAHKTATITSTTATRVVPPTGTQSTVTTSTSTSTTASVTTTTPSTQTPSSASSSAGSSTSPSAATPPTSGQPSSGAQGSTNPAATTPPSGGGSTSANGGSGF
jgi:penicillin-binding protein 1A